jgi:tripartite-type tricarboxylate transporter receptor subunit TctC
MPHAPLRGHFKSLALSAVTLCAAGLIGPLAQDAAAQTQASASAWPNRVVRFTVPAAAGTAPDIMARTIGDRLAKIWGQPVIIDNKPGAGGVIGMTALKNAERNQHNFAFAQASALTMAQYMFRPSGLDIANDFTGVAMVGLSPMMIAVSASNPATTVAELIAQARKNPDQFIIATAFQYSVPHLAADMLAKASGVPMRSVPFTQASQSVSAVINGDAQAVIDGVPPLDAMVRGGKLKALGIFSDARVPGRPDLPTVVETYPGMVINGWFGIVAPVGADTVAVERINRDLATVVAMPEIKERFDTMGVYARNMTPAQLNAFWKQEITRWEGALKDVGAQPANK